MMCMLAWSGMVYEQIASVCRTAMWLPRQSFKTPCCCRCLRHALRLHFSHSRECAFAQPGEVNRIQVLGLEMNNYLVTATHCGVLFRFSSSLFVPSGDVLVLLHTSSPESSTSLSSFGLLDLLGGLGSDMK